MSVLLSTHVKMCHFLFLPINQGRNKVYFFITDPVFLPEILIPDPKNIENFDPCSLKNLFSLIPDPGAVIPDPTPKMAVDP